MSEVKLQDKTETSRHIPVLLDTFLESVDPIDGIWLDGTFGNGGYSRALVNSGATRVIAIDRDPEAQKPADYLKCKYPLRFNFVLGRFGKMDALVKKEGFASVNGIILDLGVSSMQLDQAERGFSFQKKGPLDMRMSKSGLSAYDIVNEYSESDLANIIYNYGEERFSRRIARAIVSKRSKNLIKSTKELADVISNSVKTPKRLKTHPATRTFQALRIFVNNELDELVDGLEAAERILSPHGILAVITFHSLEDRIVKRFIQLRSGEHPLSNRFQPSKQQENIVSFNKITRKALTARDREINYNPRARSAKLRIAKKIKYHDFPINRDQLGIPIFHRTGALK